jgi:hypothetical protein
LIPKPVAFQAFPDLMQADIPNPRVAIVTHFDNLPQDGPLECALVWYNQRTRNEARITMLGGVQSPLATYAKPGQVVWCAFATVSTTVRFWLEADDGQGV